MKNDEQFALAMAVLLTIGSLAMVSSGSVRTFTIVVFAVLAWTYVAAKQGWSNLLTLCLSFWVIFAIVGWVGGWQ